MADPTKEATDVEFDDEGKPIVKDDKEGEGVDPASSEKKAGEGTGEASEEGEVKPSFDDSTEPEVPIRTSAQHIIARKNAKIAKLESEKEGIGEYVPPEDPEGLSVEAQGAVAKEVEKRVAPVIDALASSADEQELNQLFTKESEAKQYEKHIRAYMQHDMYKGVSASVIYHHLAFQNAQATGAKKKNVADLEANQSKGGGRVIHPVDSGGLPTADDISNMSEEDFEKMQDDAIQGKYVNK